MNLAFFVRGEFLSLIQIFQIFEIVKLLFWETKFQRWKGNLQSSMCVCMCVCVCVCVWVCVVKPKLCWVVLSRWWKCWGPRGHGGAWRQRNIRHNSIGAKYGRYCYPGKVIDVGNVPDSIRRKLPTTTEKYIIHCYTENNYSAIKKHKVELFTKNLIDQARAEQSPSIQEN